jgi:hypothetical protein
VHSTGKGSVKFPGVTFREPVKRRCETFLNYVFEILSQASCIGEVEFVEGLAPAYDPLAHDEPGGLVRALPVSCRRAKRSRARLSLMLMMASHSSLTTASSFGKWPLTL